MSNRKDRELFWDCLASQRLRENRTAGRLWPRPINTGRSGRAERALIFVTVFCEGQNRIAEGSRVAQRKRIQALSVAAGVWGLGQPAFASCDSDMQKLAQDRNVQLQVVNDFANAAHGKPLDPAAFCVKSAGLIRAESALIAYMERNKD
jgi:hypothetical protein